MPDRLDVAVVGAGPFGLSVAAHLPQRKVRVFGEPMQTWRTRMPPDMLLRSDWEETSLSAPADRGAIDVWARAMGEPREEPIPLQTFLRYADWFRQTFVRESDPADVLDVERAGGLLRVTTAAGDEVDARRLVVAVGVTPFPYAPPPFDGAMGEGITFAIESQDYSAYRGGRVVVVGGGQGGLESAALALRAGADVELVVRSKLRWFTDREPYRPRGPVRRRLYRLAYPVVGYGPPVLNRLALHPDAFAALPPPLRRRVAQRILRAGGSPWVREHRRGQDRGPGGRRRDRRAPQRRRLRAPARRRFLAPRGRGHRLGRVPVRARSPVVPVAERQGRDRRAGRLAAARPVLPLDRSRRPLHRLRRRAALRADRALCLRQPLHGPSGTAGAGLLGLERVAWAAAQAAQRRHAVEVQPPQARRALEAHSQPYAADVRGGVRAPAGARRHAEAVAERLEAVRELDLVALVPAEELDATRAPRRRPSRACRAC